MIVKLHLCHQIFVPSAYAQVSRAKKFNLYKEEWDTNLDIKECKFYGRANGHMTLLLTIRGWYATLQWKNMATNDIWHFQCHLDTLA